MQGTDTAGGDGRFRASDLLKQVMIGGLAISPDGLTLVYSRSVIEEGKLRKRLWRVPHSGGDATPLTSTEGCDSRPSFSPDGRSLLFLSDRSSTGDHRFCRCRSVLPRRRVSTRGATFMKSALSGFA